MNARARALQAASASCSFRPNGFDDNDPPGSCGPAGGGGGGGFNTVSRLVFWSRESPKCTDHKTPNAMTVKMSDCNKYLSFIFLFIRPLYFKKTHSVLVFIFLTIHLVTKCIMGKNLPLKIPFAFMVRCAWPKIFRGKYVPGP